MELLRQLEIGIKQVQYFMQDLVGCVSPLTRIQLVPALSDSQTGVYCAGLYWVHDQLPECRSLSNWNMPVKSVDGSF
jgi:hypothetical protein